ncbi:MAG: cytochrome-c oxidase, cbb3-type subunit III [Gammaproteobacteria bacterium]|nr:cytochrome-c oxidase, cbb3-type subunit III [Gammaproteobacteria bacterium]
MTTGWSIYVIVLVLLNLAGCWALLWWTSRRRPGDPKPEDTSHVWDGDITEYNKPLPRWWIIGFYMTILFSVGYLLWYPGFGNFAGFGKWTSAAEHDADKAKQDAILAETFRPYDGRPISELARDPRAVELGRAIFANTCATCHGSSAQGAIGYPNLADDIWHWGGSEERILETILDGREGVMPEWGTVLTGMGGDNAVLSVATYVRALAGEVPENDYFAAQGKGLYEGVCVACHGIDGKGNQDLGAPDLTDDYAMYGNSIESIMETINSGRHGVMPAHRELLGETRSRLVGSYVWSLSNGAAAEQRPEAQ